MLLWKQGSYNLDVPRFVGLIAPLSSLLSMNPAFPLPCSMFSQAKSTLYWTEVSVFLLHASLFLSIPWESQIPTSVTRPIKALFRSPNLHSPFHSRHSTSTFHLLPSVLARKTLTHPPAANSQWNVACLCACNISQNGIKVKENPYLLGLANFWPRGCFHWKDSQDNVPLSIPD